MNPNVAYFPFGRKATIHQFIKQFQQKATKQNTSKEQTIIIFGVARGGTTMAARVIRSLGIELGEGSNINYEDDRFNLQKLGMNPYKDQESLTRHFLQTIEQRNTEHTNWGWKYPNASAYLPLIIDKIRNPRLVCILRDPLASSSREQRANVINQNRNEERTLLRSIRAIQTNIELIHQTKTPTFLCSYEKAINSPSHFVRSLSHFLGIHSNSETLADAIAQIQTDGYIKNSWLLVVFT